MNSYRRGAAKRVLKDFLTRAIKENERKYEFYFEGDEHETRGFVQNVRVALSRYRVRLKEAGQTPKMFKIRLVDLEPLGDKTRCVLLYDPGDIEVEQVFDELSQTLSAGKRIF